MPDTHRRLTPTLTPGYVTGHSINIFRAGDDTPVTGMLGSGLIDGFGTDLGQLAFWFAPSDSFRIEVTYFESSERTPHLWQPKSGDYHLLWEHQCWIRPPYAVEAK